MLYRVPTAKGRGVSMAVFQCTECLGTLDLNDVLIGSPLCVACRQGDYDDPSDDSVAEYIAEYNETTEGDE